ncbi:Histone-lysine N-methyltransferase SETMAR [Eumeta japonica]|uniref:Histone-lysine N-methyltransferase SETMAR n=1 Tax=Eumeta variegata TaxID=151549 RepID=A0A4C1V9A8_EUMVA|nr:Histone-lysine N-methyltransferase SETMAR [Eumeta japonica]
MTTVFWDARGVIHIDYLEKGKTITGEYYSKLLDRFDVDLKQKRPHLAKKKVLFHQDNARMHTCLVTMAKIHELRYELLPHPAYSPDLAPRDYYLFPNLKKWLGGKRFESNEEVITETKAYFESLEKTYYLEGNKKK